MMALQTHNLNDKDRAFLLATIRYARDKAPEYLEYLPSSRKDLLSEALGEWLQGSPTDSEAALQAQWKGLRKGDRESLLYHADPAWISETFRGESPAILAILLKDLGKAKIGGVLKDLSKEARKSLKEVQVKKIPKPIQQLIKKQGEACFPQVCLRALGEDEVLKKMSEVGLTELNRILRELGIGEMALALSRVSRSAVRAILNRLKTQDAKELRKRIKNGIQASSKEQREAQLHILSLDFEKLDPEEIIHEIGFGVLSRAFDKADSDLSTYFVYKFTPRQGYLLKRLIAQNSEDNSPEKVRRFRERILDAITRVQSEG